ncbi:MAG: response regulator [Planctomycetota bacterium]
MSFATGFHVLLVGGAEAERAELRRLIGEASVQVDAVHEAADAPAALAGLAETTPSLVFFDTDAAGADMAAFAKSLCQHESCSEAGLVAVSADAMIEKVKLARSVGARGYLLKPLNADKLDKCLASAVESLFWSRLGT